ncbi:MAG: HNH endonuclease [Blastocatellales bacterium]
MLAVDPFCWYCGTPLEMETSTRDHVRPRARGGKSHPRNLVLSCRDCNGRKADHPIECVACGVRRGAGIIILDRKENA